MGSHPILDHFLSLLTDLEGEAMTHLNLELLHVPSLLACQLLPETAQDNDLPPLVLSSSVIVIVRCCCLGMNLGATDVAVWASGLRLVDSAREQLRRKIVELHQCDGLLPPDNTPAFLTPFAVLCVKTRERSIGIDIAFANVAHELPGRTRSVQYTSRVIEL